MQEERRGLATLLVELVDPVTGQKTVGIADPLLPRIYPTGDPIPEGGIGHYLERKDG